MEGEGEIERDKMNGIVSALPPTITLSSAKPKNTLNLFTNLRTSDYKINGLVRFEAAPCFRRNLVQCNSSTRPGGPPSSPGESDSRNILDAFFLGKALAEAVSERIESTVGELLSTIGRLQAEQQKQVQDFQEDVLERARRAKEKAAREAMEAQGLVPRSSTINTSVTNGFPSTTSSTVNVVSPANSQSSPPSYAADETDPDLTDEDPVVG